MTDDLTAAVARLRKRVDGGAPDLRVDDLRLVLSALEAARNEQTSGGAEGHAEQPAEPSADKSREPVFCPQRKKPCIAGCPYSSECPEPAAQPAEPTATDDLRLRMLGVLDATWGTGRRKTINDAIDLIERQAREIAERDDECVKLRAWVNDAEQAAGREQRRAERAERDLAETQRHLQAELDGNGELRKLGAMECETFPAFVKRLASDRDALRECVKAADGQLSRILHEMAGSVSLCWEPKPTGVFNSTQACEFVASAIAELRAILRDDAALAKVKP